MTHQTHPKSNGIAITALVVGIIAFLSGWIPVWGLLVGIAAVVFGIVGLKKSQNKGMSITGIVTGGLALLTGLMVTVTMLFAIGSLSFIWNSLSEIVGQTEADTERQIESKKTFKKGEAALFDTFAVSVDSVKRTPTSADDSYKAREGKEFVIISIKIKNTSATQRSLDTSLFGLNEDGLVVEPSYGASSNEISSGMLNPGASVDGTLAFEATKGAKDLKLQYTSTVYTLTDNPRIFVYTLEI